jgi:hypothetical protein
MNFGRQYSHDVPSSQEEKFFVADSLDEGGFDGYSCQEMPSLSDFVDLRGCDES